MTEVFANLTNDVVLHDAELGQEWWLRVRVQRIEQDLIDVRTYGDEHPRVVKGMTSARLVCLDTQPTAEEVGEPAEGKAS